ncbi:YicC/YloC family endoribonuclease [Aureimonas leprariae]|uniref:YicC family protein n=1 Tax=Plantimonas leprariae TaxID=2615207 RepID=A0A7V7PQJ1_9HYPH|nr:YicC/YloC family endoribonuclease [Aureimonas leprariae]KAB0680666.1 YicC family protein [Aureimonas leprariae]
MPVASMTGFARIEEQTPSGSFAWELRSVNGKGLELRLRLPPGFEALEPEIRRLASARLARGNVQVALTVAKPDERLRFTINETMLAEVLALSGKLVANGDAATPTADGLLAIRGIIEPAEAGTVEEVRSEARNEAALAAFSRALDALATARQEEGAAIARVLRERLATIADLTAQAEADPARRPAAIFERLRAQVAHLLGTDAALDEGRLHAEAALLATRADVSEELDRLRAHVEAAAKLIDGGGPVGRRLDFLSQEFNRESNTLCSKSNATSLTAIGLELKVIVDQFREQVQNIE